MPGTPRSAASQDVGVAAESPLAGLAPLIEPMAPPAAPLVPQALPLAALALGAVLLAAALFWGWRRLGPRRALWLAARCADPATGAAQLAAWQRAHGTHASAEWRQALARLRFGPPTPDAAAELARLCREAAGWR